MIYIVDIDRTICVSNHSDYTNAIPLEYRIKKINTLVDSGHEVWYWTARGAQSGRDWSEFTKAQLDAWGCKYTRLLMNKPHYDVWIDDKAFNSEEYFSDCRPNKG